MPLYSHTLDLLYAEQRPQVLSQELRYAYHYLLQLNVISQMPKLHYLLRYIDMELLMPGSGNDTATGAVSVTLSQLLSKHYSDLCTMKEADLCGSASMTERVFVSTVHKAKGLEFDHVVVYDAVEGKYPSVYADTEHASQEEARKFSVAISRARRRLIIAFSRNGITRWGRSYQRQPSRYLAFIRHFFTP